MPSADSSRPALQRRKYAEAERFKKLAAIYLDTAKRPRMKLELSNEIDRLDEEIADPGHSRNALTRLRNKGVKLISAT